MTSKLAAWARGRRSRPALLVRAMLGAPDPGDPALKDALAAEAAVAPCDAHLAALAWRAIELMDLGPIPGTRIDALLRALEAPVPPQLPLLLPTGAAIDAPDAASLAGEALALRALTKAHRQNVTAVRGRLDDLARRGPGLHGATRRASALHGLAADAVHYPTAVAKLTAALAAVQRSDGTWGEDDLFHVGQALLAAGGGDAERALQEGADALAARQEADGGFGSDERSWIACRWSRKLMGR